MGLMSGEAGVGRRFSTASSDEVSETELRSKQHAHKTFMTRDAEYRHGSSSHFYSILIEILFWDQVFPSIYDDKDYVPNPSATGDSQLARIQTP